MKLGDLEIDLDVVDEERVSAALAASGVSGVADSLECKVRAFVGYLATIVPSVVRDACGECGALVDERKSECACCGERVPAPELSDLGNVERFVRRNLGGVRYCAGLGGWLVFDGRRWALDESGAERLAKETARSIYGEIEDSEAPGKHAAFAVRSQGAHSIFAMLRLAQSEEGIATRAEHLDANPMLLNCPNGTLDLRTGELRPHDPADLLTKMTAAPFEAGERSKLWERVVAEACDGDAERVTFLRRAFGYALTGSTAEEKLFFFCGPAATSKSTIVESIKRALGDYAMTADFESFTNGQRSGGPRNDIARLAGARLVTSIEVERGRHLAEGLVKLVTGGDTVTARYLYREAFSFVPAFKLVLVANDAPQADDLDSGLWRRILRIPFERVVPKDKRDPAVKATLCDVAKSGPAILAWCMRGCLDWQERGLGVPASVEEATEAYRESQDPLHDFFEEECTFTEDAKTTRTSLRRRYERWAQQAGVRLPLSPRVFGERLRARGIAELKSHGARGWVGIALRTDPTDWPTAERGQEGQVGGRSGAGRAPHPSPRGGREKTSGGQEGQETSETSPMRMRDPKDSQTPPLSAPAAPERAPGFTKPSRFRAIRGGR